MPAREYSPDRESGTPQTFTLRDGTVVELRNGCLVDRDAQLVLTGSHQTTGYLLQHADFSAEERFFWEVWGDIICDRMSSQDSMRMAGCGQRHSNQARDQAREEAA